MSTKSEIQTHADEGPLERRVRPSAWMAPDGSAWMTPERYKAWSEVYVDSSRYWVPLYAMPRDEAVFEVMAGTEDEMDFVAGTSGPRDQALREAMHYASQYARDGAAVQVFEVLRVPAVLNAGPNVELSGRQQRDVLDSERKMGRRPCARWPARRAVGVQLERRVRPRAVPSERDVWHKLSFT